MRLPIHTGLGLSVLPVLAILVAVGCGPSDEVQTYAAPKESHHAATNHAPHAATPSTPSAAPAAAMTARWTLPEGWRQVPGQRPMRLATFEVGSGEARLEISLSSFPGDAGGLMANVNRWRGQVNLPPLEQAALQATLEPFTAGTLSGQIIDLLGTTASGAASMTSGGATSSAPVPTHIIGAVLTDGTTSWFIKATGTPAVIDPHKDAIVAFAKSFRLSEAPAGAVASAQPPSPGSTPVQPPVAAPSPSPMGSLPPSPPTELPKWVAPQSWRVQSRPPSPLLAAFDIGDADAPARVTISFLPGDGGGALANVNRWRKQVGLTDVAKLQDQPISRLDMPRSSGARGGLIELVGPSVEGKPAQAASIGLIVHENKSWFVKLTAPAQHIASHRAAFIEFIASLQLPGALPTAGSSSAPAAATEGRP